MCPKSSANHLNAAERQRRALELRRSGCTLQEIADQLGYAGPSGARRAIETALEKTLSHEARALRVLESERLDRLQRGLWPKAEQGDIKAVEAVLKIMSRRAKLFNLDAPDTRQLVIDEDALDELARQEALAQGLDPEAVAAETRRILHEISK